MRRRPFFAAIPVTFTRRKGPALSDRDLLRAWHGIPTDDIRAMGQPLPDGDGRLVTVAREARARVLRLREEAEREAAERAA